VTVALRTRTLAAPPPAPASLLRRYPVTVGALVLLPLVALATGSLVSGPSPTLARAVGVGVGRPGWGVLSSALWCPGPMSYAVAALAIALVLVPAERALGSRTALTWLLVGQVAGNVVGLLAVRGLAAAGDAWATDVSTEVVVGPLPGLLALLGVTTAVTPSLWRRRVRLATSIILVALVLYSGTFGDVLRATGWLVGLTAGALLRRRGDAPAPVHPSRREGRALVALVLAVTALGPLLAALSRTPDGPWAVVSHLFVSGRPHPGLLREVCGPAGDRADCELLKARARLTGRGPALLSVLPVMLQLVLAEGLRRGRRAAWVAAVAFTGVLTGVGGLIVATVLRTPAEQLPMLDVKPGSLPVVSVVAPLVAPLVVLVLLLLTRRRFEVRAAPGAGRRWLLTAAAGLTAVAAVYVIAGSVLSREFARAPSAAELLVDLPVRMLPPGYLGEVLAPLVPLHGGARLLADWCGVAAWLLLLVTAVWLVRPAAPAGDAARARRLVERFGEGPLSFMTTWVGNRYWFSHDGRTMVAHRVHGGVALTTGDPVGDPAARAAAIRDFTAWCEAHGWIPCWYSVTDEVLDALPSTCRVQVAAETWLPLADLAFVGKRWQDVRTALNRAARDGISTQWLHWSTAPLALREQLTRASEEWLAAKGLPEMGFTLGGLDELADPAVRALVAQDASGAVLGVTSWLPARRDDVPVGWTLDLMRRTPGCPGGVMELLIATAALAFQEEGAEFMSLSGAPLAIPGSRQEADGLDRLLQATGRLMEPIYGFRSLMAFKAKFQPRHRALWLVYPDTADLPRIAAAVSKAYLPHLSLQQAARLAGALLSARRRGQAVGPVPRTTAGASALVPR
jgi:phosphatidylglycerol lysyltransferase